jgi:hypothetical protein
VLGFQVGVGAEVKVDLGKMFGVHPARPRNRKMRLVSKVRIMP